MKKIAFTLKMKSDLEVEKSIRKTWGFMPATKAFKSIKDYNRRDKKMAERAAKYGRED